MSCLLIPAPPAASYGGQPSRDLEGGQHKFARTVWQCTGFGQQQRHFAVETRTNRAGQNREARRITRQ